MKNLAKIAFLFLTCLALLYPSAARADGIIIPDPPPCMDCPPPPCTLPHPCPPPSPMVQLVIRYHKVTVSIDDQVAVTRVDQIFFNPNDWPVEGTYMFPLPAGAAVSSFTLWVDGKPVEGKILDAEQARQEYQQIVSSLRDPALLEYAGEGAVQAHIFPIPPQGERRIELEYSQALPAENGLVRYIYPLSTEKFSLWPLEEVSISVDLRASVPIRAAYSPSHAVDVSRESDTHLRVGYEASQVTPDADFALYYSLGEQQALHLLSYRDPSNEQDADGFFLLMLAPRPESRSQALPKDVLLVLDRSGSMEGEKFQQAQQALTYILQHLNEEDRFNVITFSTGLDSYAPGLRPASEADQATHWVEGLSAMGSTDINRALLEAAGMADAERPTYLIFLTDGLPTEGVVESPKILANFESTAAHNLRLFAFGVGYDVDTFLLDSLAVAQHGATTYVLPGERIDEILSAFYAKISTPVLTDLELDFGSISAYDLYPSPLPDLFSGSQIILLGRYRQGGATTITLNGILDDKRQSFEFPDQVFAQSSTDEYPLSSLPRLWATRKIGYLLNQVRLKGADQETIDQIVHLSIRYGIVTPYTSYLVSEQSPLGAAEQERIAKEQYNQLQAMPPAPASGAGAVQKAADLGGMEGAMVPAAPAQETANRIRLLGSRTFLFDGEKWVDTAFDPERMQPVQVVFLSKDYFALTAARPDLAAAFSLGPAVIAISDGVAYQVVAEGVSTTPIVIPPTYTPAPGWTVVATYRPVATLQPSAPGPTVIAPTPQPSALTCTGGLLPLLITLAGLAWLYMHKRY
jgi:Ca-activated chloride channel family protein